MARMSRKVFAGKAYLSGNYAPVADELFVEDLEVTEGQLPEGLDGCYMRAGPNPFFKPVAGYHWFDGDGMLHGVRLKGGRAAYCNRWVATERLAQERAAGRPLFVKLGDLFGKRGAALMLLNKLAEALGVVHTHNGRGTANTALAYHAGRVLALHEGDLPYGVRVLCNGLIETLGRFKFAQSWKTSFTAHPKVDPVNGDMMFIGYRFEANPYVSAGVLDKYGNLKRQWGVALPYPVMMHDMAATEHYVVLLHLPLCFDPQRMIKDASLPFVLKRDLPGRLGLLRREQPSLGEAAEVQWFEIPGPGFMAFHVANAFEDPVSGAVKVYACQMDQLDLDLDVRHSAAELGRLTEYALQPATGAASSRRLSDLAGDFPVVHPGKATRPCRYTWMGVMDIDGSVPSFTGIAKMDLAAPAGTDACIGRVSYPAGCFGGEAVFVPRPGAGPAAAEDDGYLVVYVYVTAEDASYMHVYDAAGMSSKPVAAVRLPRRVPYGFHGTWVTEEQIQKQVMWV